MDTKHQSLSNPIFHTIINVQFNDDYYIFTFFLNMCSSSPFFPLVINFETIAIPFIIKYIGGRVYHPTPTEKKTNNNQAHVTN